MPRAAETARLFGAEHEPWSWAPTSTCERLPGSLLTLEEPVGSTSALAVRFVAELMRPSVPVALTGQGADEPLGGYGRHLGVKLATELRRVGAARAPARQARRPRAPATQLRRGLATLDAEGDAELLLSAYTIFSEEDKGRLYGRRAARHARQTPRAGGGGAPPARGWRISRRSRRCSTWTPA